MQIRLCSALMVALVWALAVGMPAGPPRAIAGQDRAKLPNGTQGTGSVHDTNNNKDDSKHPEPELDVQAQVDRLARPLTENQTVAGLSIGVVNGDKIYFANYGHVGSAETAGPDENTLYEMGSVSKVFTGTLLADAVVRKLVRLSDPVQEYLPASVHVPSYGKTPITLLDLATQRSGLPRLPANLTPADPRNPYADYDEKRLYAFLSGYKLTRRPGEKYEYSNLGMGLLGFALARQAGKSYEALLTERVLKPLEMNDTLITLTPSARKRLAPGHNADGGPEPNWDLGTLQGAGGIRSTVQDMTKFIRAYLGQKHTPLDTAVELAQKRAALIEPSGSIGLAWHILPDDRVTWHNGGTGGYSSMLAFDRARHQGVVVLCNTHNDLVTTLGFQLIKALAGENIKPLEVRKTVRVDRAILERYVGQYQLAPGAVLTVTRDGDQLLAQLTGQPRFRIYPSSETEFFWRIVDASVSFTRGEGGRTTGLVLHQNGHDPTAKKVK